MPWYIWVILFIVAAWGLTTAYLVWRAKRAGFYEAKSEEYRRLAHAHREQFKESQEKLENAQKDLDKLTGGQSATDAVKAIRRRNKRR